MTTVKIINKSHHPMPQYSTANSAGMDLRACIEAPIVLKPLQRILVPTGIYIALPEGYEAQVRPRSGLALKHGVTVLNTPGTIDADYRGEIMVPLHNHSKQDAIIEPKERIAQMIITPYLTAQYTEVEELNETVRGESGFGSTGRK